MSFINLWAFAFLALLPILILLYFLKLKRSKFTVASTLLWQKVIEDMRVNSPFQKLRKTLLMFLQILLLLLLIFALARPWLKSLNSKNKSFIVMLDTSASMMTVNDEGKTRLDEAKEEIEKVIDSMTFRQEMMIVTFNTRSKIEIHFKNNKKLLLKSLKKIEATDATTSIADALQIAKSLGKSRESPQFLLFSDGGFADPGEVKLPKEIEYTMIGKAANNLAITGMSVRRKRKSKATIELFVGVKNFSPSKKFKGNMLVYLDDKLLDSRAFSLKAGDASSQIYEAEMAEDGIMKVEFETDDDLKVDNVAYQIVEKPQKRSVLLVSDNAFYIEKALYATVQFKPL
ncbi:MAG: VWA domain-containing protein [Lentisphaeria bacterium]|nr:VWA domain-containing protein [Lentisphaeria bacterium]